MPCCRELKQNGCCCPSCGFLRLCSCLVELVRASIIRTSHSRFCEFISNSCSESNFWRDESEFSCGSVGSKQDGVGASSQGCSVCIAQLGFNSAAVVSRTGLKIVGRDSRACCRLGGWNQHQHDTGTCELACTFWRPFTISSCPHVNIRSAKIVARRRFRPQNASVF